LSIVVLAFLLFRAYVPLGFMPANGQPFLVELCPAVTSPPMSMPMSMPMAAHPHHPGGLHGHFADCPFGSAFIAGPACDFIDFFPPARIASADRAVFVTLRVGARAEPAHPARGPPAHA
jgi:hypothetical protein